MGECLHSECWNTKSLRHGLLVPHEVSGRTAIWRSDER